VRKEKGKEGRRKDCNEATRERFDSDH
jgi:hypothetical protein